MARKFQELVDRMSPGARERAKAKTQTLLVEMALDELRQAREMTQEHLARILGVNQAAISKLERRTDMYVSTLADFVKAMGGQLEILAKFPEGTVQITQFKNLTEKRGTEERPAQADITV